MNPRQRGFVITAAVFAALCFTYFAVLRITDSHWPKGVENGPSTLYDGADGVWEQPASTTQASQVEETPAPSSGKQADGPGHAGPGGQEGAEESHDPPKDDPSSQNDTATFPVSRLHYLVPASKPHLDFCYNLVSSAANRYPPPLIVGYNGTGEFDAAVTHLAKLRAIKRYLDALDPTEDDDLVLIIDGYDVLMQLPPEIMIERYFRMARAANAHLAKRFGLSVASARDLGLYQSVFWGADKICWPINPAAARCWAVPKAVGLPHKAFGPHTGEGGMVYNEPRWLNSGTVIGPVADMRELIAATMEEINDTYNPDNDKRESDQLYISNIWGRQEYFRSIQALKGKEPEGGPPDRVIPSKRYSDQETEYHISLDYESDVFQTKAGYEPFYGHLQFNSSGLTALVDVDYTEAGDQFVPTEVEMPANVYSALGKLYESIPEHHHGMGTGDWARSIKLGVNFVTKRIYPLWHSTGTKIVKEHYGYMWFYPWARSLMKATVRALGNGTTLSEDLIDGRKWIPKMAYPDAPAMMDELGGAWTDYNGGEFVVWDKLCGKYNDKLFAGEVETISS